FDLFDLLLFPSKTRKSGELLAQLVQFDLNQFADYPYIFQAIFLLIVSVSRTLLLLYDVSLFDQLPRELWSFHYIGESSVWLHVSLAQNPKSLYKYHPLGFGQPNNDAYDRPQRLPRIIYVLLQPLPVH